MKEKVSKKFNEIYGEGAILFASPGRINLIGEHTDYNLGFVLPGAIDKAIYVALKPNDGTVCRVYSLDYDETVELNLHGEKPSQQWACYVYGVCQEMEKRGALILPFDMAFGGDVPLGAGLSSSAALESAVGFALNETYGLGFDREQLAKIGQMTEHNYVGVRCGIMDQFASLFGEAGHTGEKKLLLCGYGVGLSWASCLWQAENCDCAPVVDVPKPETPPTPEAWMNGWRERLQGEHHELG